MNRALRMTDRDLEAQALADALAANVWKERRVPVPPLPREANDLPICTECCIEVSLICCPVHGVRPLPDWLLRWLHELQNRRARETEANPQAAVGYWSQATDSIIVCPECQRKLVAPNERTETVRCPKCLATWRLMSNASAKVFHANDTHPDQALGDLNDTLGECAIPAQPGSRGVDLELVANEVFAELRRRGVVCGKAEIRSYVEAANAGRFVWGIDNRTISETIEHVADRWQAAENRPEWEDVG